MKTHFSASHLVEGYEGDCKKLHGHNWKIQVRVKTDIQNEIGISFDFKTLKGIVEPLIQKLDHEFLNDLDLLEGKNPTAENLSEFIYYKVKEQLPEEAEMDKITVWETDKYSITYEE